MSSGARRRRPLMASSDTDLELRRIEPGDRSAVLELLSASLGWLPNEHFDSFFSWKHEENPFGPSPGWVAVDRGSVVGFRTFLRWEYERADGEVHRAVRAVDTATHPDHQGRGIFRQLTLRALDELAQEGVGFVFNTPNSQSRPGYLKMGWTEVGRLPTSVRLTSLRSPWRMVRSRVPAERWSTPSRAGRPALEVLADPSVRDLLDAITPDARFRTRRTPEYLRWRYGFGPLEYRALTVTDRAADGFAVFRLRRRGSSLECALVEVLVPEGDRAARRGLIRSLAVASGADYLIRIGGPVADRSGFIRAPQQGPMLTWRPLGDGGAGGRLGDWDLSLGDVELF
jgi:GNAT superfamily N-acetyltransferase